MSPPATPREGCSFEPAPREWRALLLDRWSRSRSDPRAARFRAQLGLEGDRPVVMTGHQPVFFHPGVLAKYMAASALAGSVEAAAVFLVVDQDETDPGALRIPARSSQARLEATTVRLAPAPPEGTPAGRVPARPPLRADCDVPWPFVSNGLGRIAGALDAHADAISLAEQAALASFDLMHPLGAEGTSLLATRLADTDLFRELVERMLSRPLDFVERYNAAVAAHPGARVSPLLSSIAGDRYELPLWILDEDGRRRRAFADAVDGAPPGSLAARALFMTLLVRLAGCDLFIHGAGGFVYDRITEELARSWLGEELAPMTLATATVTLPLLEGAPPTAVDVARAKWLAHHAAHDPEALGDERALGEKRSRLARIAALPRGSRERSAAFRAMHAALEDMRQLHAGALEAMRGQARRIERDHADAALALDRGWAFPLHPDASLERLRDEIGRAFR